MKAQDLNETAKQQGNGCPPDTDEPEGGKLSRFTVLVGGKVLITMMGCLLCAELRVPLLALDFQGAEIAFHVSLIQVVIAGRPEH